jgi:hypothetical protein
VKFFSKDAIIERNPDYFVRLDGSVLAGRLWHGAIGAGYGS